MNIRMIGQPGPSLPMSIRTARARANEHVGKGDPVWSTQFTTKFSRKPPEDAPMVTPIGTAKVSSEFLDRVAELRWLEETQHYELATTQSLLKANGLAAISLDAPTEEDMESANIAESHLRVVPLDPDPAYIATMSRRIEWEQYIWKCGPVHTTKFVVQDGILGIMYEGPDSKNAEKRAEHRRAFKAKWLDTYGRMPTVEELEDGVAFVNHYKKAVLAMMSPDEYKAHHDSRRFGAQNEDPDPERTAFNGPEPRPNRDDYSEDEIEEFYEDTREWERKNTEVGYAGPSGLLHLDDAVVLEDDDMGSI